jgi:3-methyl-2-oxobutanoate hydroxymethyltransferase
MLTAYSAPMAALADAEADMLLVGDSVGMVLYGLPSTLSVSLDMMIAHGAAVVRGSARALVVVDMPFGAYEESPEQAFRAACRVMAETGAGAVKLEGGERMAKTIRFLTRRGIPVMAHVGMTPQAVNTFGGFKTQGRNKAAWAGIRSDAAAVAEAGAFSMVIEAVAEPLAAKITQDVAVPTIGIGASAECDGQVLVFEDMMGLTPRVPKFVRRYGAVGEAVSEAVRGYAEDVRARRFPGPSETYDLKDD